MLQRKIRTHEEEENALNAAQGVFSANPVFLAPQTKHFFQAQERVLDELEKFSNAWFQRRQEAMTSMVDAGRRILAEGETDPSQVMSELTEWQSHSMERLTADAKDCAEMISQCAGSVVTNEAEAVGETIDGAKKAAKLSRATPV